MLLSYGHAAYLFSQRCPLKMHGSSQESLHEWLSVARLLVCIMPISAPWLFPYPSPCHSTMQRKGEELAHQNYAPSAAMQSRVAVMEQKMSLVLHRLVPCARSFVMQLTRLQDGVCATIYNFFDRQSSQLFPVDYCVGWHGHGLKHGHGLCFVLVGMGLLCL